jgi:hypothetical protein
MTGQADNSLVWHHENRIFEIECKGDDARAYIYMLAEVVDKEEV